MKNALLVALFGLMVACGNNSARELPPDFVLDGMSAADYSAEWWKWAMSSPANVNPVRDTTGEHCAVGQSGDVWFLAGGFGSAKIRRSCTVPKGKYLFFPAVNTAYWPQRQNMTYTCEQARAGAAVNNDSALSLFVEIDNYEVESPGLHRAKTMNCFNVFERVPPEAGAYNAWPSASDGYWYMIEPLSEGIHTIKFGGRYNSLDPNQPHGRMVQDIEYTITIE